jgi:hypothetical protein
MKNLLSKLPTIVWILLIPLGIVIFIGAITTAFYLIASVEGVASILMLIAGAIFTISGGGSVNNYSKAKIAGKETGDAMSKFFLATGICFFALMGMAIDQPGNFIYNKPIELIYCPPGSGLNRIVDVSHPLPGRTDITQDFTCRDAEGKAVKQVGMFEVIGVRFFEYVVIAYLLMGFAKLVNKYRYRKQ